MESTYVNPLAFFEFIISEKNIYKILSEKWESYPFVYTIFLPDRIEATDVGEYNEPIEETIAIKDELLPILRKEFEKSTNFIIERYIQNTESQNISLMTYIFNTSQSLINNRSSIINRYPYLLSPLRAFVKFINDRLLFKEMPPFKLSEEKIKVIPIDSYMDASKTNLGIINSVIEYMAEKNEKGVFILNNEDWSMLKEYTIYLIEKEKVPTISKKLKPNLSNNTISFSFWVLHKELYETGRIRHYFYDFIKAAFTNFENTEISSIKSQFGTRTRVKKDRFLPEIIKKYL